MKFAQVVESFGQTCVCVSTFRKSAGLVMVMQASVVSQHFLGLRTFVGVEKNWGSKCLCPHF